MRTRDKMSGRWLGCVVVLVHCGSPPHTVTIAQTDARLSVATVTREEPPSSDAALLSATRDGVWARTFPHAKDFARIELPAVHVLVFTWRIGKSHPFRTEDGDEYPLPVSPLSLSVVKAVIPLGEHGGTAYPALQSYCYHSGWRQAAQAETSAPRPTSIASYMSVGTMQGDSEFMIVRDEQMLHVLTRETSDGRCDEAKQGPLDICVGSEWNIRAELRVAGDPALYERLEEDGEPFTCGRPAPYDGPPLLPPTNTRRP